MLNEQHSSSLLYQLSNNAERQHEVIMSDIIQQSEYRLLSMLNLKPFKDGNQWCVVYGDNIQVGICGFGDTPYKAMLEFNKAWYKS